tara:strand:+ start:675 stop:1703 length:1029 start_codon:yes stop_codon:yes gene_type:complete
LINFFKNLKTFIHFKKNEKLFKRIIFNENLNTKKYLDEIIKFDKKFTCLISLQNLDNLNLNNTKYFYFDNNFIISIFFIFLKIRYLYTSTPDLNNSIFRKSIYKKTKYIYIQHSPVSLCMIYKHNAFVNFDCIQVVNKNQNSDVSDINKFYNKNIKTIKSKYLFLNNLKNNKINKLSEKIDYLIAPTWNTNFYELNFHKYIFDILDKHNKSYIFRPHYMSIKNKEFEIKNINIDRNRIDLSPSFNFENFRNLITDWSGIYLEFLIIKRKKPILFNSKMKVRNNNYKKYSLLPIELELRSSLANQFDLDELDKFSKYINKSIINDNLSENDFKDKIRSKFYNI